MAEKADYPILSGNLIPFPNYHPLAQPVGFPEQQPIPQAPMLYPPPTTPEQEDSHDFVKIEETSENTKPKDLQTFSAEAQLPGNQLVPSVTGHLLGDACILYATEAYQPPPQFFGTSPNGPLSQNNTHPEHFDFAPPFVAVDTGNLTVVLTDRKDQKPPATKRGPFVDLAKRKQTAETRKIGSCIRCRMQRIRVRHMKSSLIWTSLLMGF